MLAGYKTLLLSLFVTIVGALETMDPGTITDLVPDKYDGLAIAALGVVIAALRLVTNGPVAGKKE